VSIRNLDFLFHPRSVAVIGASKRAASIGSTVMRNLLAGGFDGPVMPVNPKYRAVAGVLAYPDVSSLPEIPDLGVICTPPATVPSLIDALGSRGAKAAVVLTAGLAREQGADGRSLHQAMLDAARPHLMRILGPNCVGIMIPGVALNASFAHTHPAPGHIAFVTQSGALATAVLDWARSRDIGFSHFISLGDSADVDFGDVLDYLGSDPQTSAILLYIESIQQARKFMSAARAAARNKPVLAIKAGRVPEGAKAAASHTGALAGADDVYDAAIRRAGMLRVEAIEDLFDAVETLGRARPSHGDRLAILTNGGGPGVMATDALMRVGGRLAALEPGTVTRLDAVLPANWSRGNPVDIIGDAPAKRYVDALQILLDAPELDAVLLIHAPTAIVSSTAIADALAPIARRTARLVLSSWLGGGAVEAARRRFSVDGLPTYDTPEDAVKAFMQTVDYRRNQAMLAETPQSIQGDLNLDAGPASDVIDAAVAAGRTLLTEVEAKRVIAAYGVPVVDTRIAESPVSAARAAQALGFPVAVKVLSPDITHKSDIGGVVLDLATPEQVTAACEEITKRMGSLQPDARLEGFTVQAMVRRPGAHELIVGATTDPVFGPVVLFGHGGTAVEVIADRALSLPPLNLSLARDLIGRTRVARLLAGYRDRPAADEEAICRVLIQISRLVADLPQVQEIDINPLLSDSRGVVAVDARIRVAVALRPIRPEDEPAHREFFTTLNLADIRFRFFGVVKALDHSQLARYTQIDYEREMAFIAVDSHEGRSRTLGVVRAVCDPDNVRAEFAIVVRSDMKGRGLGAKLLDKLIRYLRLRGTGELMGEVLASNQRMLSLAKTFGFRTGQSRDGICALRLDLRSS
jgi:acetyltransferase